MQQQQQLQMNECFLNIKVSMYRLMFQRKHRLTTEKKNKRTNISILHYIHIPKFQGALSPVSPNLMRSP